MNRPHDHGHGEEHEDQEGGSGDVHELSATPDVTENLAVLMPPVVSEAYQASQESPSPSKPGHRGAARTRPA